MNIYDISFSNLIHLLTPTKLRKDIIYYLLVSAIEPIRYNLSFFKDWKNSAEYKLRHTGQVIYLEKVLNDRYSSSYDAADHRMTKQIYITDGEIPDRTYIYRADEQQPLFLNGTVYISTHAEYLQQYNDFIINVPASIAFSENQLRALVDFYKIAGKFYKINIV